MPVDEESTLRLAQAADSDEPVLTRQLDVNGDDYEHWVIKRSFAMLRPISGMGFLIDTTHLIVVDPLFYMKGLWDQNEQYLFLTVWHGVVSLLFGATYLLTRFVKTHTARTSLLSAFFVLIAGIFAWFGFISWFLIGDFSIYAVALLCLATVFVFPGPLRRSIYVIGSLGLAAAVGWADDSGRFVNTGVFVNLIVLVVVTYIIDGFIVRTTQALFREKCKGEMERKRADDVLYNALPVSIADDLKHHKAVKAEKYQHMTILFADIVGFTRFSSALPPDAVIHVLNQIFSEFDLLVDRYRVEKIKTIGDAYMVVGKGPGSSVADLALEMLHTIRTYNEINGVHLELRLGMNIGPTVAGVIGLKRFLYDVWGDSVNTASRLESSSAPGRIHVSEVVYRELQADYEFEDRGIIELRGKGPMHTYFLGPRRVVA